MSQTPPSTASGARARPHVIATFVASADGRTAPAGGSRALTNDADRELHRGLRESADAVLAGPATMLAEDYMRMLPDAERRARRVAAGRPDEPLAVTVTRSGRVPWDIRLLREQQAHLLVFSAAPAQPPAAAAERMAATVELAPFSTLTDAMARLHRDYGVETLLCEGGPRLLGALLAEQLVDELMITLAPTLAGGQGPTLIAGTPLPEPVSLRLIAAEQRDGTMFLRYAVD